MSALADLREALESIIVDICAGVDEALEASVESAIVFVAPQIDLVLSCYTTCEEGVLQIVPHNAFASNYYGLASNSEISAKFSLLPK